jgi:hypothetical protein
VARVAVLLTVLLAWGTTALDWSGFVSLLSDVDIRLADAARMLDPATPASVRADPRHQYGVMWPPGSTRGRSDRESAPVRDRPAGERPYAVE